jgi:hypothetical protein
MPKSDTSESCGEESCKRQQPDYSLIRSEKSVFIRPGDFSGEKWPNLEDLVNEVRNRSIEKTCIFPDPERREVRHSIKEE